MIAIWDNRLSVGDAAIDAEHRLVLNLLNELDVAFAVNAPPVVVEKALEALVRAVDRHFARDADEPVGPVGRHLAFATKVARLLDNWRQGDHRAIDRRSLLDLGRRWIDHMGYRESPGVPARSRGMDMEQRLAG
ncbi:hypothetical protein CU669_05700 [Paramagnetospirillum kuznetsovii]|uniref:Hemerythrin-like domain-containing protein n=1 Tax=Paramagnetospirillum kuznetsovii TaxID=2053833 RepID=A0A364P142_9PROT|nr:hypothetical protein [Paramagnetospirillum kuznetsovii]RAU22877.1 hypothetical protein CU669_05700 [Paramagnetospirillum kuznetsovii]